MAEERQAGRTLNIKVVSAGCDSCKRLYENVQQAVEELGLAAEVRFEENLQEMMKYNVKYPPALIVNEKVVSMGRVLKPERLKDLLSNPMIY